MISGCRGWDHICRLRPRRRYRGDPVGCGDDDAVIVLIDQIVWRPVIAWAEKFKVEQVESTDAPQSWFLDLVRHSRLLVRLRKRVDAPAARAI